MKNNAFRHRLLFRLVVVALSLLQRLHASNADYRNAAFSFFEIKDQDSKNCYSFRTVRGYVKAQGWTDKRPLLSVGDRERAEFRNLEIDGGPVDGIYVVFLPDEESHLKEVLTGHVEKRFLAAIKGRPTAIVTSKDLWQAIDRIQYHTAVFVPYECSSLEEARAMRRWAQNGNWLRRRNTRNR
jgi:hypothetical protein